jgi:hypothetical protein
MKGVGFTEGSEPIYQAAWFNDVEQRTKSPKFNTDTPTENITAENFSSYFKEGAGESRFVVHQR